MMFRPFGSGDVRLKVALELHEPLIHFALVCGAKSCPPIKTYSANGIADQVRNKKLIFPLTNLIRFACILGLLPLRLLYAFH